MQAMQGIKVIDLTRVVSGPYCTYQLALMGAECIKIEDPGKGDQVRRSGAGSNAYYRDRDMATNFLPQNSNKKSITLDLRQKEGKAIFLQLIKDADVLVENFRAGVMTKLGLDYQTLIKINPKLVFCSLTAYGQNSPKGHHTAYDGVIQAASGMMTVIGTPETGPMKIGPPITDYATGMAAAFAIATALFQRSRDGQGQYIDVSMLDTALSLMSWHVTDYLCTGNHPQARGNEPTSQNPSAGTYETLDGKLTLGSNEEHQYRRLCKALGLGHFLTDPRFELISERRKNNQTLYQEIQKVIATRTAIEWEGILNEAGVPATLLRTIPEILGHEQITSRGLLHKFDEVPGLEGSVTVMLAPFKMAHDGPAIKTPPPRMGEHTEVVLKSLGLQTSDLEKLKESKVI